MARMIGLRGGLWILGLLGGLVLLPLAIVVPSAGAFGFAALAFLATVFAAVVLSRRAAALAAAQEKLSAEIGVLSRRLLKAEAALAAAVRPGLAGAEPPPAPGLAEKDAEMLAAGIEEVTTEIGLLSGIVRELAAVVAAQDGEIGRLKAEAAAPPPAPAAAVPVPAPLPVPLPAPELTAGPRSVPARAPVSIAAAAPPPAPAAEAPAAFVPRAAFPPRTREPAVAPAPGPSPQSARDPVRDAAVVAAFDGDGLDVWLQPVVTLPQRKVVSYEALARLKVGGELLAPEAFLPVLERHGRTTALDRRMIRAAVVIARHLRRRGSEASVAYGLSPLSLFEPDFLRSLAGLVGGDEELGARVAVVLPQASWRSLDPEQTSVLKALRGRVGFGLDRPRDLRFDAGLLAERGVTQIKVPAAMLLRPLPREALPDIAIEDLVAALSRAGIRLVATEVEREGEVPDLIDLDAPLAQGTVFAGPKAVRADVLAEPAASPAPQPTRADPAPEPPQQRRPFRDFLRRAV